MIPLKKLYYDVHPQHRVPVAGGYLVSIGKKGIGTIYRIIHLRRVNSMRHIPYTRYMLSVAPCPHLKGVCDYDPSTGKVYLQGEPAFTLHWYPRSKNKK